MAKFPWKPYDVEQAKKDVVQRGAEAIDSARNAINAATEAAVEKLVLQAKTFAQMPPDVGTLFEASSHVLVEEITPRSLPLGDGSRPPLTIDMVAGVIENGAMTNRINPRMIELPPKRHRLVAFFLPIED